jgi:SAM-dependent methyltransferase
MIQIPLDIDKNDLTFIRATIQTLHLARYSEHSFLHLTGVRSDIFQEVLSSTTSISSSILNYRRENGRTYHAYKDGKYVLPNDEAENERLDLQHNLFLLTLDDRLGLAPPNESNSKAKHVLDIGTGTGIWAIDYADEHPETQVIGVDLSPIQPAFVPPNLTFMIEDIEDEWNYSQSFDYIHSRFMSSAIASWTDFLTKCYKYASPLSCQHSLTLLVTWHPVATWRSRKQT